MSFRPRCFTILTAVPLMLLLSTGCPPTDTPNENGTSNENNNSGGSGNENTNTNSGGSNENANSSMTGGACGDGTSGLRATLSATVRMDYRELGDGCREFVVRAAGAAPGNHDVTIRGALAGNLVVAQNGNGVLVYTTDTGSFPSDFPTPLAGDAAEIAGVGSGSFAVECPVLAEVCGGSTQTSTCDEDATDFLEIVVERDPSSGSSPSPCTIVKATLETNVAAATFINHHPTRTIAIAAILIPESDRRQLDPSPCGRAVAAGTFGSNEQCLQGLAEGCNSPPGLFLAPGAAAGPWLYVCKDEGLFGSGPCGSQVLETTTTYILAHAVFCGSFTSAQASFCGNVHAHMLLTGTPNPEFFAYVNSECP